jgi:hypothetical protein
MKTLPAGEVLYITRTPHALYGLPRLIAQEGNKWVGRLGHAGIIHVVLIISRDPQCALRESSLGACDQKTPAARSAESVQIRWQQTDTNERDFLPAR